MKIELDADHQYTVDGAWKPGVTTILKHFGLIQYGAPGSELEHTEAMQLGTATHATVELFEKGTLDRASIHPEVLPRFNAYLKFKKDSGFVPRLIEHKVYSEDYQFCGTLDLDGDSLAYEDLLIDLKNGAWQKGYDLQMAGYAIGLGKKRRPRLILELCKDETYKPHWCKDQHDYNQFLSAVSMFWWKFNHGLIKQPKPKEAL